MSKAFFKAMNCINRRKVVCRHDENYWLPTPIVWFVWLKLVGRGLRSACLSTATRFALMGDAVSHAICTWSLDCMMTTSG